MRYMLFFLFACNQQEYSCEEYPSCETNIIHCSETYSFSYEKCVVEQFCGGVYEEHYYDTTYRIYKWVRSIDINRIYNCDFETNSCVDAVVAMAMDQCQ